MSSLMRASTNPPLCHKQTKKNQQFVADQGWTVPLGQGLWSLNVLQALFHGLLVVVNIFPGLEEIQHKNQPGLWEWVEQRKG
jgi:hypothetical protein